MNGGDAGPKRHRIAGVRAGNQAHDRIEQPGASGRDDGSLLHHGPLLLCDQSLPAHQHPDQGYGRNTKHQDHDTKQGEGGQWGGDRGLRYVND